MGELRDRRIVQSRIWLDPDQLPLPPYDYDYSYPITVYDAVKETMDDNAHTLTEEIAAIYRLINTKQDIIDPGKPGWLMTWTGIRGNIGELEVVKVLNPVSSERSHQKIPTEKAIGDALDYKVSINDFNEHVYDNSIHITDVERTRWDQMAPLSMLQAHIANTSVHITEKERGEWNNKASQEDLDNHRFNTNNPHNVNAHQVGTYTQREIDEMFKNIRESFFNYLNIYWDDRNNSAKLEEYNPSFWNPNYILEYGEDLPDEVPDPSLTYFALRPNTDYRTNETQDCVIWVKRPGLAWQEVGFQSMNLGDMVIRYPDTTMFVWVQGRWLKLFSGNVNDVGVGGESDKLWRPTVSEEGILSWEKSSSKEPPAPINIKGQDGKTPQKGVDYVDGKDGEGVAVGGRAGDLLVKLSDENFDTTWKSLMDMLGDLVIAGSTLPKGLVIWGDIIGKPEWYNELGDNEDGFITQKAVTYQFEITNTNIAEIQKKLQELDQLKDDFNDHINDFNNPHRVTPGAIGAVPLSNFTDHVQNFENPHHVTADQLGLGNVDNTADLDKPISHATQEAIDELLKKLNELRGDFGDLNPIVNVMWDDDKVALTFTFEDASVLDVHIPITEIFQKIYYDDAEKELVIVLPDGTENRIDISGLIDVYIGSISDNIQVTIENDNVIKATIIPGTVGSLEIAPSVHLRMSPTTTTQPVNDRSTRIATTEFVKGIVIDNLISYDTDRPLSANMGRYLFETKADIEDVIRIVNELEGIEVVDNLDSTNPLAALSANMGRYLDLTKAPRVHTSPEGSTFGRATISLFGHTRASSFDPYMDGTVFKGTDDGYYARGDHRHPTDITRAPIHWPDVEHDQYKMTGEPRAETPPNNSNDDRIATTEWVRRNAVGVSKGYCSTGTKSPYKKVELRSTFCVPPYLLLQIGSAISVTFRFEDRSGSIPTMLNVNDTGWHKVLYRGEPLLDGMIGATCEHLFVYDGEFFRLENPVPGTGYGTIVLGPGNPTIPVGTYMPNGDKTTENQNGDDYNNNWDNRQPADLNVPYNPISAMGNIFEGSVTYPLNQIAGINGFTLQADGPVENAHGEVERVEFNIPYESRVDSVEIEFPEENDEMFGAQMGDGTIIDISNPKIIDTSSSSATVQFTLKEPYASNSPCGLVYKNSDAWIKIKEV